MTCSSCSGAVERALQRVRGVTSASVSLTQRQAQVVHCTAEAAPTDLVAAIEVAGFDGALLSTSPYGTSGNGGAAEELLRLDVAGMTCGSCSTAIEKALAKLRGVTSASVSLVTGELWGGAATYICVFGTCEAPLRLL